MNDDEHDAGDNLAYLYVDQRARPRPLLIADSAYVQVGDAEGPGGRAAVLAVDFLINKRVFTLLQVEVERVPGARWRPRQPYGETDGRARLVEAAVLAAHRENLRYIGDRMYCTVVVEGGRRRQ